jgi:cobalt-zinc-cadmium efflux system protein
MRNITIAFFLNLVFTVIEIVGGLYTNSLAILSDALHDLGDSVALGLAFILERISGKDRTPKYSYGFRRYSLLSALINSLILLGGSIFILTQAIPRILNPQPVRESGMLLLAVIGIVVNGIAVLRMRGSQKLSERTVMLHLLEDVLGWVAVLIGSLVMMVANVPVIDPVLSIAITVYVLFRSVSNLSQTMRIFLQGVPPSVDVDRLVEHIRGMNPIVDVHDVHVWTLDGQYNVLTLHVVVPDDFSLKSTQDLRHRVRQYLSENRIQHATIEVGRESEDCGLSGC